MTHRIAVLGATGLLGREILQVLAEQGVPAADVVALTGDRAVGGEVSYGEDDVLRVGDVARFDFSGVALAYSALEEAEATIQVPRAAEAGTVVIDLTPRFRMEPDVPLVAADVNPQALAKWNRRRIIATPSVMTLMVAQALSPVHDAFTVLRAVVTTYQAVSAAGRPAMDELFNQTRGIYVNEPASANQTEFAKQIAFNVIPAVGGFEKAGATGEERALAQESVKIFGPDFRLHANCALVPVFVGHSAFINIECEDGFNEDQLKAALRKAETVSVVDYREEHGVVTPAETPGEDMVFVSRVRLDPTAAEHGASFWISGDNLRRPALNAVRIGDILKTEYLG